MNEKLYLVHIIHLIFNFLHKHGLNFAIVVFLYRMGVIKFIWHYITTTLAYLYLIYAYIVVGKRKIVKILKHK